MDPQWPKLIQQRSGTPPSIRFLTRRVYWGFVVMLVAAMVIELRRQRRLRPVEAMELVRAGVVGSLHSTNLGHLRY